MPETPWYDLIKTDIMLVGEGGHHGATSSTTGLEFVTILGPSWAVQRESFRGFSHA